MAVCLEIFEQLLEQFFVAERHTRSQVRDCSGRQRSIAGISKKCDLRLD